MPEINEKIGIIDGTLENENIQGNVILNTSSIVDKNYSSHGTDMIEFLNALDFEGEIYYFSIDNFAAEKATDEIITALEWMKKQGVKKVNLSYSSKRYSRELEMWINNNVDNISIYASYNNLMNTNDYPAMYKNVIGSGYIDKVSYGNKDVCYTSNDILVVLKGKIYRGTSYLSLYTMLTD